MVGWLAGWCFLEKANNPESCVGDYRTESKKIIIKSLKNKEKRKKKKKREKKKKNQKEEEEEEEDEGEGRLLHAMAVSMRTTLSTFCAMLLVPTLHFSPLHSSQDHQHEQRKATVRLSHAGTLSHTWPWYHVGPLSHTGTLSHTGSLPHAGPPSEGGPVSHTRPHTGSLSHAGLPSESGPVSHNRPLSLTRPLSHTSSMPHAGLPSHVGSDTGPLPHAEHPSHTGTLFHTWPLSHAGQPSRAAGGLQNDGEESHDAKTTRTREVSGDGELPDSRRPLGPGRPEGLPPFEDPREHGQLARGGEELHHAEEPPPPLRPSDNAGGPPASRRPHHDGSLSQGGAEPSHTSAGALSRALLGIHSERHALRDRQDVLPKTKAVREGGTRWASSEQDVFQTGNDVADAAKHTATRHRNIINKSRSFSTTTPVNDSYFLHGAADGHPGRHWRGNAVAHRWKRSYTLYRYDVVGADDAGYVAGDVNSGRYDPERVKNELLLLYQESFPAGNTNRNNGDNRLDVFIKRSGISGIHENADDFFTESKGNRLGTRSQPVSLDEFYTKVPHRPHRLHHNVKEILNKLSRTTNKSANSGRNYEAIILDKLILEILNQLDVLDSDLNSETLSLQRRGTAQRVSSEVKATILYLFDRLVDDRSKGDLEVGVEVRLPVKAPRQSYSRRKSLRARQEQAATPIAVHTRGGKRNCAEQFFPFSSFVCF